MKTGESVLEQRIKTLRIKKKMSQKDLGDALGISQQSVWKWETGINKPDTDMLIKLADLFDVSCDYILGRTNHKKAFILEGDKLPPELKGLNIQLEVLEDIKGSGLNEKQIKHALRIYKLYMDTMKTSVKETPDEKE